MRVLVVEDEPKMAYFLARGLRHESYAVDLARDGDEALYQSEINDYDIVLLDVGLPLKDGFTVCRQLRQRGFRAPILMLTALEGVRNRITALDDGADDYLAKPFNFQELLARMRALLRRGSQIHPNVLAVADLTLNVLSRSAARGGLPITLTPKEYALLELFMLRPDEVLGRSAIAEHVWDENFDAFSNVIDVYVNKLRKKIEAGGRSQMIFTRRGEGYMLRHEQTATGVH